MYMCWRWSEEGEKERGKEKKNERNEAVG